MIAEIEDLYKRVDEIEKQRNEEVLTLVEILSNATFFGKRKKDNCKYAKNEQCSFFIIKNEAKNKIPIVADCRVTQCEEISLHCHIELSNITCAFCEITNSNRNSLYLQDRLKKLKEIKSQENLITKKNKKK